MRSTAITLRLTGFSAHAIRAVEAAVTYAEENNERREQNMSLPEFCKLVGLPATTERAELVSLMSSMRKATSSIRIVDNALPKKKEIMAGSWPVFQSIFITSTSITFEVCPYMWENVAKRF